MSTSTTLTTPLLRTTPALHRSATQCPFLRASGAGTLPKGTLSQWLAQDRVYAENYLVFIDGLLAKVRRFGRAEGGPTSSIIGDGGGGGDGGDGEEVVGTSRRGKEKGEEGKVEKVIGMLEGARDNIEKELEFFAKTARGYGLDLSAKGVAGTEGFRARPATERYVRLFRSFEERGGEAGGKEEDGDGLASRILDGLVLLWATERCYLDAWSWAGSFYDRDAVDTGADLDGGALRKDFIPNWSSGEFRGFVEEAGRMADEWAGEVVGLVGDEGREKYVEFWKEILEIERDFWPPVEGWVAE